VPKNHDSGISLIREWFYRSAPVRFRELFPEGRDPDWLVHVPKRFVRSAESLLLRWRPIYPVRSVQLADGSFVYFGAPSEAINIVANKHRQPSTSPPFGQERRSGVRIPIECRGRYEMKSRPRQTGVGHTIDMSSSGVSFTTESPLPVDGKITLHITWPVRLESDRIVELRAFGTVTRTEGTKAALKFETMDFLQDPKRVSTTRRVKRRTSGRPEL
jgi:hypothetical protein